MNNLTNAQWWREQERLEKVKSTPRPEPLPTLAELVLKAEKRRSERLLRTDAPTIREWIEIVSAAKREIK